MPFFQAPSADALLEANGGADGYVQVGDATNFWPGAHVWLRSTAVVGKEYIVTDVDGTYVGLRIVLAMYGGQTYGRTPVTEYLVADGASLHQESQVVPAEIPLNKVTR